VQVAVAAEPAATPKPAAPAAPSPKPIAATSKPAAPASTASADGPWRVQLGAFAVHGNADKLWAALSGRTELAGKAKLKVPAGAVTKLQAGGYADREAAEDACRSLKRAGHDCLVTE
jgi:cell division septation protein DedD